MIQQTRSPTFIAQVSVCQLCYSKLPLGVNGCVNMSVHDALAFHSGCVPRSQIHFNLEQHKVLTEIE